VKTYKFTLFVYCNFLVLLSTTVYSQNINKQNVNIADETLTNYSFLSRYHFTKSKNYLKRRSRICHCIPMFFGTPCIILRITIKSTFRFSLFKFHLWRKIFYNFTLLVRHILYSVSYVNIKWYTQPITLLIS